MPNALRTHRTSSAEVISIQLSSATAAHRSAAVWNDADDRVLIAARASGLNWQPIATRHFPTKTANACRKRHERLMERRTHDDWDGRKLDALALEYMECRKEMWTILAARLGDRWGIIEAKCMERGLKNMQAIARSARKRAVAAGRAHQRGNAGLYHEGDSGIGCSDEDAEMEVGDGTNHASTSSNAQTRQAQEHTTGNNQPEQLAFPRIPLYQPPVSAVRRNSATIRPGVEPKTGGQQFSQEQQGQIPEAHGHRGVTIRSMLSRV